MNIIDFQKTLKSYYVFSWNDIQKIFPKFNRIQLDR